MLKAVPRVVGLAVVWLVLTGCASSTVRFPNATPATPREVPGQVYRPEGTGPFPAVVLLHGCQGVLPSTRPWGRWVKERGYLALVVDRWAGRCAEMAASMRGRGADVSIVVYPGAFHYFDVEGQARTFLSNVVKDDATGAIGATVAYDPAADADAHRRVSDFFGYHLRRQLSMAPARVEPRVASDRYAEHR